MSAPTRPVLRYHGGKWRMAPWIISHFPAHRIYVEPFGGAASVLMQKPRSHAEVYNDRDDDVVNLFRVLRDETTAAQLVQRLELTPYARVEFDRARDEETDPVERAAQIVVRATMGYGSDSATRQHGTGFRSNVRRIRSTTPAHDFVTWPDNVTAIVERLQGVVIENREATRIIAQFDSADTLVYCDPPYMLSTRQLSGRAVNAFSYRHEMSDFDHVELAAQLHGLQGTVVVSGYPSALYDNVLYRGWDRFERQTAASAQRGSTTRTEVIWIKSPGAKSFSEPSGRQLSLAVCA